MSENVALSCTKVSVNYGSFRALDKVSFDVKIGQITALLGPSGCGKSTLLRAIAGLERPSDGDITWEGESVLDTPTYQRGFGLMFQDGQLFPHRNVEGNIAYGLRHLPRDQREHRVAEVLAIVGLEGFASRSIESLSGGQAQRVALARALAPRPRLLLLDEPLSALDRTMRESLSVELREIITGEGITSIYVTHDQDEAFAVADQIGVMIQSRLRRIDTPEAVWANPGDSEVARFLGFASIELEGTADADEVWIEITGGVSRRARGYYEVPARLENEADGEPRIVRIPFGSRVPTVGERVKARASHGIIH